MLSVRSTRIAAGLAMSISLSTVPAPPEEMVSARRPWISSSPPEPGIDTASSLRGTGERASTARSRPPVSAKTVVPSVLTMSGSSTPASWTLVVDESGVVGAGAATGVVEPPSSPPPEIGKPGTRRGGSSRGGGAWRSEEHTSELQSHSDLVCRLLLAKKNRSPLYGLAQKEKARIRTKEDPLRNCEVAMKRNEDAGLAVTGGDIERAIKLYDISIREECVSSHPYERLAS